jgi:hypothetical protein
MLNDSPTVQPAGEVHAELVAGGRRVRLCTWAFPDLAPQHNAKGPTITAPLPEIPEGFFLLELSVVPNDSWSSSYRLSLRSPGLPPQIKPSS